ncbi:glycosyltransferase family 4 protein|uniref:glycosyltransferase family 4 protein n=1 Tax=Noviherbaspirillum sp. L7-7A TaxID=2850560 RepID=UPI001C2C63C3|nr:glycosyltransferase family 4 protein [Noviherbaspirillum sp. L7-7A]MBV0877946.1 glycosyltransferase family 4 protein [Noviherbaspirillum sp. L7-7A]
MDRPTVLLSVNTAWNAWNFRTGLIDAIIGHGYRMVVAAPADPYAERLVAAGCEFIDLPMDSNGTHPGRDLRLLMRYLALFRQQAPAVYLGYTIKPNIYGSLAAQVLGIPVINNIAGLGAAFISDSMVTRVARLLYRTSLRRSARVFFQNPQDRSLFLEAGLARADVTDLLPGSGICLARYQVQPAASGAASPCFLLVGRMLVNKGVVEFAEAARIVRRSLPQARFQLLGPVNEANSNLVPAHTIAAWEAERLVEYLGAVDDVRPHIAAADCVVLPSYREGVPRTLLEAAAIGRPIIATDVAGCVDVVEDGINGMLCRARDPADLADKMLRMAALPAAERERMGMAGRRKVEQQFDEALVIGKYLDAITAVAERCEGRLPARAWSGGAAATLDGKGRCPHHGHELKRGG